MKNKIIILAALLLSAPVWAGNLSVDNLTVSYNANIYGALNIYAPPMGGSITTNGGYRIHTFTTNGTFTVFGNGLTCDVLVVAGGGGGGSGGGGGGGVVYSNNYFVPAGAITVTVGGGGKGYQVSGQGDNGSNSIFNSITAYGGGGGGRCHYYGDSTGRAGGSGGGGGSHFTGTSTGGLGTNGQGYAGGNNGGYTNESYPAGGGGGAGQVGQNATSSAGGNGGNGYASSISGSAVTYGGGGGGGVYLTYAGGTGGTGGGGNGGNNSTAGVSGTANSGGGGGGSAWAGSGNGGSGIVIVRYLDSSNNYVSTFTVSSNGVNQIGSAGSNVFMSKTGVGTNNPAEKLHVNGNVRVDGAVILGGETRTNWPSGAQGALMASNNLSELTDKAQARANLGIGTAATNDNSAFLAPAGDGSQLTGLTAAQAGALAASSNLADVANAATARANLGLGSAATSNADAFLAPTGNGSQLTGITASQVGALTPNGDGSQLTNITASQVGALSATGGVVSGNVTVQDLQAQGNVTVVSNLFVNGTNIVDLITSNSFSSVSTNLNMNTNRIVNLAGPIDNYDAVNKTYLWTTLSNLPAMGDLSMGIYTNQSGP